MNVQSIQYHTGFSGFFRTRGPKRMSKAELLRTQEQLKQEAIKYRALATESVDLCTTFLEAGRASNWKSYTDKKTGTRIDYTIYSEYDFPSTIVQKGKDGNTVRIFKFPNPIRKSDIYYFEQFDKRKRLYSAIVNCGSVCEIMPSSDIQETSQREQIKKSFSYYNSSVSVSYNDQKYSFQLVDESVI